MKLTPRNYMMWLGGCLAVLLGLLAISPGVGTASATYGWWDVWRAALGVEIPAGDVVGRPVGDMDGDGELSDEELQGFTRSAKLIFSQGFRRTVLTLQKLNF